MIFGAILFDCVGDVSDSSARNNIINQLETGATKVLHWWSSLTEVLEYSASQRSRLFVRIKSTFLSIYLSVLKSSVRGFPALKSERVSCIADIADCVAVLFDVEIVLSTSHNLDAKLGLIFFLKTSSS